MSLSHLNIQVGFLFRSKVSRSLRDCEIYWPPARLTESEV